AAALLGLIALVTVVSFVGVTWGYARASDRRRKAAGAREEAHERSVNAGRRRDEAERDEADTARERAREEAALGRVVADLYGVTVSQAARDEQEGRFVLAEQGLDACPPGECRWEWDYLKGL